MLPDFPSLKDEIEKVAFAKLRRRVDTGDPVFSEVRRFSQHEGSEMRYEQYGGTSVQEGPDKIGAVVEIQLAEVPGLVGERFEAKLESIAQNLIAESAKAFFAKIEASSKRAGTAFDAGGKPVSAEMLLDMMERVQTEFTEDGDPTGTFVIHPDMLPAVKEVADQIENDPELKRRNTAILERQREAWIARESNRKLVD